MEILINNKKIDFNIELNQEESIGCAVDNISSELKKENKVLCQIKIDDVIIPEDKEKEVFSFPLSSIKQMDITAETVENLVINGLESLNQLLPELVKALNRTADFHRSGNESDAKNMFLSSLEALEIVPTILTHIRAAMHLDFDNIKLGKSSLKELEDDMLKAISSIYEAQKKEDYVTFSDVLEYELVPNLLSWEDVVPEIKKICEEKVKTK